MKTVTAYTSRLSGTLGKKGKGHFYYHSQNSKKVGHYNENMYLPPNSPISLVHLLNHHNFLIALTVLQHQDCTVSQPFIQYSEKFYS